MARISIDVTGLKKLRSSVWQLDKEVASVDLSEVTNVVLRDGQFGPYLRYNDGADDYAINFRSGVRAVDGGTYTIAWFVASADWTSDDGLGHIAKGDRKLMAY